MAPQPAITLVEDYGIVGDSHARSGSRRQVLLIEMETLKHFSLSPGQVRENITTMGLDLAALGSGAVLRVNSAELELTIPCETCSRLEEIRPGLEKHMMGRRGFLARVVKGGIVRVGDTMDVGSRAALGPASADSSSVND